MYLTLHISLFPRQNVFKFWSRLQTIPVRNWTIRWQIKNCPVHFYASSHVSGILSSSAADELGVNASVVDGTPSSVGWLATTSLVIRTSVEDSPCVKVLGRERAGSKLVHGALIYLYHNTLLWQHTYDTTMPNMTLSISVHVYLIKSTKRVNNLTTIY